MLLGLLARVRFVQYVVVALHADVGFLLFDDRLLLLVIGYLLEGADLIFGDLLAIGVLELLGLEDQRLEVLVLLEEVWIHLLELADVTLSRSSYQKLWA